MVKKEQQTLVLIKPDALQLSLTGYILSYLAEPHTGLIYAAAKIVNVQPDLAREHYAEHKGKIFFDYLTDVLTGKIHYQKNQKRRRVEAIVFHGKDAIKKLRYAAGPTNPLEAKLKSPGKLRTIGSCFDVNDESGNFLYERYDNLIHASKNKKEAEKEIRTWFKPNEIPPKLRIFETVTTEDHFYYQDGKLFENYKPGSICILAPGDLAWKKDLQNLKRIQKGKKASQSLASIILKYQMNQ